MTRKLARHEAIEARLRADIAKGICPVGTALPTEYELAAQHGVSRFTIRRALSSLRAAGLVEPRKGHGTFVIADAPRPGFVQTLSDFEELLQYPEGTLREHLNAQSIALSAQQAGILGCAAGTNWMCLSALRSRRSDGQPFAALTAWIRPDLADVTGLDNPEGKPLLRQIEDVHGVRARLAQVDVLAVATPAPKARLLGTAVGAPALLIRRRYRGSDGQIYLATEMLHPESRFALSVEFARG